MPGGPPGELLLPSPLLVEPLPYVLVHFQFEPEGRLTSPRVPPAAQRRLAVPRYLSEKRCGRPGSSWPKWRP